MSDGRARKGGRSMLTTLSRYKRSSRKRPWATSSRRLWWLAAITRTSTWRVSSPPMRSKLRSCRKRRSLTCKAGGMAEISSRNRVPPAACCSRPSRRPGVPAKAPLSWPKSSLSSRGSAKAAQWSLRNGSLARGLCSWMAVAISSLPVPGSPVISTLALEAATCGSSFSTFCMAGELPTRLAKL